MILGKSSPDFLVIFAACQHGMQGTLLAEETGLDAWAYFLQRTHLTRRRWGVCGRCVFLFWKQEVLKGSTLENVCIVCVWCTWDLRWSWSETYLYCSRKITKPGLHADFACLLYSMLENKLPEDIVQDVVDLGFALPCSKHTTTMDSIDHESIDDSLGICGFSDFPRPMPMFPAGYVEQSADMDFQMRRLLIESGWSFLHHSYYMRITWWFPEIGLPPNQSKSSIYGSFLHSKPTLIYGNPHILGFISFANSCTVESHEVGRHNSPAIFIFSGNETWLAGKSTIWNHLHLPIFFHGLQDSVYSVYHLVQGCSIAVDSQRLTTIEPRVPRFSAIRTSSVEPLKWRGTSSVARCHVTSSGWTRTNPTTEQRLDVTSRSMALCKRGDKNVGSSRCFLSLWPTCSSMDSEPNQLTFARTHCGRIWWHSTLSLWRIACCVHWGTARSGTLRIPLIGTSAMASGFSRC